MLKVRVAPGTSSVPDTLTGGRPVQSVLKTARLWVRIGKSLAHGRYFTVVHRDAHVSCCCTNNSITGNILESCSGRTGARPIYVAARGKTCIRGRIRCSQRQERESQCGSEDTANHLD